MSYMEEWVAAYEEKYGKRPHDTVIQVVQHVEKVGEVLRERGRKDAQNSEKPYLAEMFVKLAQYAFHSDLDDETAQVIGELWQADYMEGYQEAGT